MRGDSRVARLTRAKSGMQANDTTNGRILMDGQFCKQLNKHVDLQIERNQAARTLLAAQIAAFFPTFSPNSQISLDLRSAERK